MERKQSTETKISYLYSSQFIDQFSYRILREFSVFAKLKVLVFVVSWKLFVLDLLAKSVKSGEWGLISLYGKCINVPQRRNSVYSQSSSNILSLSLLL